MTSAEKVKYAFAVFGGMVLEVYSITAWLPAYSTFHSERHNPHLKKYKDRYEFVGKIAPDEIRNKYIGKMVGHFFAQGATNPIKYLIHE